MPVFENEKEFETVLMENQEILNEWFSTAEWSNQVQLPGYGIADIVGVSCEAFTECDITRYSVKITLIELKVGKIKKDDIVQICRYKTAIRRMIDNMKINTVKYDIDTSFYLIGSDVGGDSVYLFDNIPWLGVMTYEICPINGLDFSRSGDWYSRDEDISKQFKNILPLAMLAKYTADELHNHEKEMAANR